MIHKVIIVGTGPSGTAAALGFAENGIVPLILDVGKEPHNIHPLINNFYEYRKMHDTFDVMIGSKYEMLNHVITKRTPSPKVSSPYMQYVLKDADRLSPIVEKGVHIIQSFAKGGMANAWGAGLYRFLENEFINTPVNAADLVPYYDRLTKEIGISGDDDDLAPFFGSTENLLSPLKLSRISRKLYSTYQKNKQKLNYRGVFVGRPRLGVLSQEHDGRIPYDYCNLEMWFPKLPYIYNPVFTLEKLIKNKKAVFAKSILVKSWSREAGHITVNA